MTPNDRSLPGGDIVRAMADMFTTPSAIPSSRRGKKPLTRDDLDRIVQAEKRRAKKRQRNLTNHAKGG